MKKVESQPSIIPIPTTVRGLICPVTSGACKHNVRGATLLYREETTLPLPCLPLYEWVFNDHHSAWLGSIVTAIGFTDLEQSEWSMTPEECCLTGEIRTVVPTENKSYTLFETRYVRFHSASHFSISSVAQCRGLPLKDDFKPVIFMEFCDIDHETCRATVEVSLDWLVKREGEEALRKSVERTIHSTLEAISHNFVVQTAQRAEAVRQGRRLEEMSITPAKRPSIPPVVSDPPKKPLRERLPFRGAADLEDTLREGAVYVLLLLLAVAIPVVSYLVYNASVLDARITLYEDRLQLVTSHIGELHELLAVAAADRMDDLIAHNPDTHLTGLSAQRLQELLEILRTGG
eukprot:CAMPEP_0119123376 /NCGR_PEP_ID=MMETSP1310-20130426/3334_1 /TAXON_ID=464262 /ORGANISM="Genus nov. species nov., Strain RCC2339" /LENGTH=346 /DNA_ID=CAMNT_0007113171 /DNA_START=18 /DNA_END=1058 /DNA_ORIENTATION=+